MMEAEPPSILLVIITYNSAEHIEKCLDSVSTISSPLKLVVLDNASRDGSAALAERHPSRPIVIRSDKNLGFARGVNTAAAVEEAFEFLLLLNPDAVLHPGTVEALFDAVEQYPNAGLYGGKSLDLSKRSQPSSVLASPDVWQAARFAACLGILPFTSRWEPDALPGGEARGIREVPAIEGSMLLVSASAWRRLGGFDERFFLYGEDVDLCMRARQQGYCVIFSDQATYTHVRGASSSGKALSIARMLRGRRLLYDRYAGRSGVGLLTLGVFLRAAFEPLVRADSVWRYCWRQRAFWLGQNEAGADLPAAGPPVASHRPALSEKSGHGTSGSHPGANSTP